MWINLNKSFVYFQKNYQKVCGLEILRGMEQTIIELIKETLWCVNVADIIITRLLNTKLNY